MHIDQIKGCMFGLAFGDALAASTEFLSVNEILRRWPPNGPVDLDGDPSLVTDDTQMALAVGEALVSIGLSTKFSVDEIETALRKSFIEWFLSSDNNRAPGRTCLNACGELKNGKTWLEATVISSKGCGANMRVAPVAFLPERWKGISARNRAAIAQFQAAITHGHPTALAASDLTVFAITTLSRARNWQSLIETLRSYIHSQREVYHFDLLGALWERSQYSSAQDYISSGWDDCLQALERLEVAYRFSDRDSDPCLSTGEGWVAEEAFATGLLCFLLYPNDPVKALQRAAVTSGDSDSIASLTGAFAGAYHGISAWPIEWGQQIEYRNRINTLIDSFAVID
jgi:ADP-ribosylglycohydrolase